MKLRRPIDVVAVIITLFLLNPVPCSAEVPPYFILKWGASGSGQGQFRWPKGIGIDKDGMVYVSDTLNDRIQVFTNDGIFLQECGSAGSGDGELNYPVGLTVDDGGYIYIADEHNNRVQKFQSDCTPELQWPCASAIGVAVSSEGYVYVTQYNQSRVSKYTDTGTLVHYWGGYGSGDGQFARVFGIAIDSQDHVYVADYDNHRIQKFTKDGEFITKWGSHGSGNGQFKSPMGLAVDFQDRVYVADHVNHRIQKFTSDGVFLTKWGSYGGGDGQFSYPSGVVTDNAGNVFVSDYGNHRVQKFAGSGGVFPPCTINNEIIAFEAGAGGYTDAEASQGYPDGASSSLGESGSVTILFPCWISDGNGVDLMVFEEGVSDGDIDENYRVEVSVDGEAFVSLGECPGDDAAFDLSAGGLSAVRYVRVIDLPPDEGATSPRKGADIDAVVVLNLSRLIYTDVPGEIVGTAVDEVTQEPLGDVTIAITEPAHMRLATYAVDGSFEIDGVPPGVYRVEATHRYGAYHPAYATDVQVSEGQQTELDFALSPAEPALRIASYRLEDSDSRITMGDHVTLWIEIENTGGPEGPGTLVLDGSGDGSNCPDLLLFDDGNPLWGPNLSINHGSWAPGEELVIAQPAYVSYIDPDELRLKSVIPKFARLKVAWNGVVLKDGTDDFFRFDLQEISFEAQQLPEGYGNLRSQDCLRRAASSGVVRQYANYAASNRDAAEVSNDPDNRYGAAANIHATLTLQGENGKRIEFLEPRKGWRSDRVSDVVLVRRRFAELGHCVQWADLSTGLLRAIGIETRDVYGRLKNRTEGEQPQGHFWNEFYDAASGGWVHYDAALGLFNDPLGYSSRTPWEVLRAKGDKNPSSYSWDGWWSRCMLECINLNCSLCLDWSLGTFWGWGCFEDRIDFYSTNLAPNCLSGEAETHSDSIEISIEAPTMVVVSQEFPAYVILMNRSSQPMPEALVSVDKRKWALDSLDTYSVTPDTVYIPEIAPGGADTAGFDLEPMTAERTSLITATISDSLGRTLNANSILQSIFGGQDSCAVTIKDLIILGCPTPSDTIILEAIVLDDSLNLETDALVIAHIQSLVDTSCRDSVSLEFIPQDSLYRAQYAIPSDEPVGLHDVTVVAMHPTLGSHAFQEYFEVLAMLDLSVFAQDSCSSSDTVEVRAIVTDREDTLDTGDVTFTIQLPSGVELATPVVPDSNKCYIHRFVPRDYWAMCGTNSFPAGQWSIKVSVIYGGRLSVDSVALDVSAPDLAIDSVGVSVFPPTPNDNEFLSVGITVVNSGNDTADSSFISLCESIGDSMVSVTGEIPVPIVEPDDSARIVVYLSTRRWAGDHELVAIADSIGRVADRDRTNNSIRIQITIDEYCTAGVTEDLRASRAPRSEIVGSYPNPFTAVATLEFVVEGFQFVSVDIYDVKGQHVRRLINRIMEPNRHTIVWDGNNDLGGAVSSGIYFCRIEAGGTAQTRKMVLAR